MQVVPHPSPNFGERRGDVKADLIVLHYTAMESPTEALDRLCCPDHEVSAHYLIHPCGSVYRLVEEDQRAWHAGAGGWGACTDVNSRSIGIELSNTGTTPFAHAQMNALETLLPLIMDRWAIPPERVVAHSDVAPSRKCDPGRRFDWQRLARLGLSIWPDACDNQRADLDVFVQMAARFGYLTTEAADHTLDAFRQRFRPWCQEPLDETDMGLMGNLAIRFPVDQSRVSA